MIEIRSALALQLPVSTSTGFNRRCACGKSSSRRHNAGRRIVSASASVSPSGSDFEAWSGRFQVALKNGAARYKEKFIRDLKSETGLDAREVYISLRGNAQRTLEATSAELQELRIRLDGAQKRLRDLTTRMWPRIVDWNRLERWKDLRRWNARRIGALCLFCLLVVAAFRGLYVAVRTPKLSSDEAARIAETYLDTAVPHPTAANVRKARKMIWRDRMPDGLRVRKEVRAPDGTYQRDPTFVGENAWQDHDDEGTDNAERLPWQERLAKFRKMIADEEAKEDRDVSTSRYVVLLNPEEEVKQETVQEDEELPKYGKGFWAAKSWWMYRPNLPYAYFLRKVDGLQVESAVYSPDMTRLYVTMKEGFPAEYTVKIPVDPYLNDMLLGCGVEVDVMPRSRFVYALRAYAVIFPCLLVLFTLDTIVFSLRQSTSQRALDVAEMNLDNLVMPWDAEAAGFPSFNDVIVTRNVWAIIEEVANYMENPMKYYNMNIRLPRGILVHGPPGTGKTHLARAMAKQMKLPFIFASGSEFGESVSGGDPGRKKIFDLFYTARANAPSVVFIDEIDALAGKHVEEDFKRLQTFKRLLMELDAGPVDTHVDRFAPRQAFILICATNRKDDLHEGLLQPGRIDRELYVGLPKEAERVRIFRVHSAKYKSAEDVDFQKIVYRTKGFSGADIRNFVDEVANNARQRGSAELCQQDILEILDKQLFEAIGMAVTADMQKQLEAKVAPSTRRLLAVHEAGHILLAHLFPTFDWHAFSHLLPAGQEAAMTIFYPPETVIEGGGTIGYVRAQMVVSHGGHCAEKIVFGEDVTDGWRDDLSRISALARELAVHYTNPKLGPLSLVSKPDLPPTWKVRPPDVYPNSWNHPESVIKPLSVEVSELLGREIQRYIDDTEKLAMNGLTKNRHILERLADELDARVKLTGDEAKELVNSMHPVLLPDLLWRQPAVKDNFVKKHPPEIERKILKGPYDDLDVYAAPLHRC